MLTSNGDSPNQNNTQTGEIYVVMVYVSSILTLQLITLNNNNMIYTLKCNNGKEIDMTSYINLQMEDKITRQDVLDRIEFYKSTNQ